MKIKSTKANLTAALCCLGSLAAVNVGWATVEIEISAVNGIGGLTSTAYSGGSQLASSGWAGAWQAQIMTGPGTGFNFLSFCTDIGNSMGNGTYTYNQTTFSAGGNTGNNDGIPPDPSWANGGTSGQRAALIYNNSVALAAATGNIVINGVTTTQAQRRSAMCVAIWEALYEDGTVPFFSVSARGSGRGFQVTSNGSTDANNAIATANYWLLTLNGGGVGPAATWFAEMENPDVQSLMGPENPIPEPGTYLAGVLLLLPFFASTLRTWRRKRA